MYTIKTVTSLTGINTETLRAWERRYGTVTPIRDGKGRRLYTQQDVERLTLLMTATQQGFTISKIAELSNDQLQDLLNANQDPLKASQELFFVRIVDALLQFRMDLCEDLLRRALVAMEPLSYAREILLPTLQKVGNLWHEGKLTIAQEHMFSACVKRIVLSMVNHAQPLSGPNPGVMFATISGEHHEFGILLSCWLAASQRCRCYYIGPDLPWEELLNAGIRLKPAVIVISVVNSPPDEKVVRNLSQLSEALPKDIQLWIGGIGAEFLFKSNQLPEQSIFTANLDDFYRRVERLIDARPNLRSF